jgi:pimeloyl-ACP methyl ester carboxylesterase
MKKSVLFLSVIILLLSAYTARAQKAVTSSFTESEVVLNTPTGDISGTLVVPDKVKKSPVVLIIAGSGPTDRDCNSPLGIKTNAYKMVAEALAANKISSLRFDKRGIGKSKGALKSESDITIDVYINDVILWINKLKQDKRFKGIIIMGHSEGSLIGMIAAEKTSIAKYISLAGSGRPADVILHEQLQKQLPPQMLQESDVVMDSLKAGHTVKKFNPLLASLYRASVQPYMISWLKYDPAAEIKKLKIPVLLIQGTTDIQVSVEDAKLLSAAKPDAKLMLIENMNHILKEAEADRQKNVATYTNPDLPLKSELMKGICDFINGK